MALKGCGVAVRVFVLGLSLLRVAICVTCSSCAIRVLLTDRAQLFHAYTTKNTLFKASLIMMAVVGLFAIASEVLIWLGATWEHRPMIAFHFLANAVVFVLALSPMIMFGVMAGGTHPNAERIKTVSETLDRLRSEIGTNPKNSESRSKMDSIQTKLQCCGWENFTDWNNLQKYSTTATFIGKAAIAIDETTHAHFPLSCCRRSVLKKNSGSCRNETEIYVTDCKSSLLRFVHDYSMYLVVIVALFEVFALLDALGSALLLCKISVILRPGQKKGFFDKIFSPGSG